MSSGWLLRFRGAPKDVRARAELLALLKDPPVEFALALEELITQFSAEAIMTAGQCMVLSGKSEKSFLPSDDSATLIATSMSLTKVQSQRALDRALNQLDEAGRKPRPCAPNAGGLTRLDIGRAINYLREVNELPTIGTVAVKMRKKHGVSLVKLFRVALACMELSDDAYWLKHKQKFEKDGWQSIGMQVCIVPFWVVPVAAPKAQLGAEGLKDCGAACMKHPDTPQMCHAYKSIVGLI